MSSPPVHDTRPRLTGLWRHPDFMKLWTGQTVSSIGSHVTGTALPLAAIIVLNATPAQVGLLAALETAPVLLVGLFAGVWADRLRRRPILIASDLGRAAVLALVPIAAVAGMLRIELLYAIAAVAGALTVFSDVAHQAYVPALVERSQLVEGNSKLGLSSSVAEISGPPLGGVLVQWLTAPFAIVVDAVSFLFSAACIALIRAHEPAPHPPSERPGIAREIAEGLRVVVGNPVLRALAGTAGTFNFFGSFIGALYAIYLIRDLHLAPAMVGVLVGLGGVGGLGGSLVAGRMVRRFGIGHVLIAAFLLFVGVQVLIPLAGVVHPVAVPFLAAAQLLGDVWIAVYFIADTSLRQASIPVRLLGRANATLHVLMQGAAPLGALMAGFLGTAIGVRPTLVVALAGMLLGSLWLIWSPVRRIDGVSTAIPETETPA